MKRKKPSKSSPSFENPEIQQIEQLFQFMTEHNLEEFEYSRGDLKIRLRKPFGRGRSRNADRGLRQRSLFLARMEGSQALSSGAQAPAAEWRSTEDLHLVKSPIVARFMSLPVQGRRLS